MSIGLETRQGSYSYSTKTCYYPTVVAKHQIEDKLPERQVKKNESTKLLSVSSYNKQQTPEMADWEVSVGG